MKTARKLNFNDTFRVAKIINAAGITVPEILELIDSKLPSEATKEEIEAAQNAKGIEFLWYIINKAPKAEEGIYTFLSSISGKTPEEIKSADIPEIIELIRDIFETNKDIKDFFIHALRSSTVLPST